MTDLGTWRLQLVQEREALVAYLQAKVVAEDWHGASDACCDLRDVDAQLEVIDKVVSE